MKLEIKLNPDADMLDDLRAALDWIEQRATTEKDGLLVERLQKTIAKGTIK